MLVLLVKDEPTTSNSIEMMLIHANLNVYATDLGEKGIDIAKLHDCDSPPSRYSRDTDAMQTAQDRLCRRINPH